MIGTFALASLWLGSNAGLSFEALLVAQYGGLLLLGWWLVRLVRWLVTRRRTTIDEPVSPGRIALRWLWEPLTIVGCWAIVLTGIAFPLRFAASRPALDRYVAHIEQQGDATPSAGEIVGLFRLREVDVLPGGVVRLITTTCMLDDCGVVYSPNSAPPRIGEDVYRPLSGGWWHWFRSW